MKKTKLLMPVVFLILALIIAAVTLTHLPQKKILEGTLKTLALSIKNGESLEVYPLQISQNDAESLVSLLNGSKELVGSGGIDSQDTQFHILFENTNGIKQSLELVLKKDGSVQLWTDLEKPETMQIYTMSKKITDKLIAFKPLARCQLAQVPKLCHGVYDEDMELIALHDVQQWSYLDADGNWSADTKQILGKKMINPVDTTQLSFTLPYQTKNRSYQVIDASGKVCQESIMPYTGDLSPFIGIDLPHENGLYTVIITYDVLLDSQEDTSNFNKLNPFGYKGKIVSTYQIQMKQ